MPDLKKLISNVYLKLANKLLIIIYDICMIPCAWSCAYWLRYNMGEMSAEMLEHGLMQVGVLILIQTSCYYHFKVYRGVWRFSSLSDVIKIIKAVITASMLAIPILFFFTSLRDIPRSVLPMYMIILTAFLCGGRLVLRVSKEKHAHISNNKEVANVLVLGAGQAGEGLVRDIQRHVSNRYRVVGLLDDKKSKKGVEIRGVRVLGTIDVLPELCQRLQVKLVFIAIASARSNEMRRIVSFCEQAGVEFRTLPSILDIASGVVDINTLRKVKIEDLLGRDQVELEWTKITQSIAGKRVLVTGGGGSIGGELCRQIARFNPAQLVIVDNSEYNLYQIEQELSGNLCNIKTVFCLVSVIDELAIDKLFEQHRPQIVFHAAAYKHVPMLEHQARTAVRNNILGTKIVATCSDANRVEKFVLISTDKAVNPTNVMGASKRIAEIFCQNLNDHSYTQFITVRFGNVLGSAGSVVPLFQKQLQQGGPLTVTHPEMCRYFMTIPEASQLILQAMSLGVGGEIFVLDMGEPIRISYLAEQMILLSGKLPYKDIEINFTGLRAGEKLFEELFHDCEKLLKTNHKKILKASTRSVDLRMLQNSMLELEKACSDFDNQRLMKIIKSLVPEYAKQVGAVAEAEEVG